MKIKRQFKYLRSREVAVFCIKCTSLHVIKLNAVNVCMQYILLWLIFTILCDILSILMIVYNAKVIMTNTCWPALENPTESGTNFLKPFSVSVIWLFVRIVIVLLFLVRRNFKFLCHFFHENITGILYDSNADFLIKVKSQIYCVAIFKPNSVCVRILSLSVRDYFPLIEKSQNKLFKVERSTHIF